MHAGVLPTFGGDLGQGGAARRTFAPGTTDLRAALPEIYEGYPIFEYYIRSDHK